MPPEPPALAGPPAALRAVLAAGVPADIHVTGDSMHPTLPRGTRVKVSAVDERTELRVGDLVVIATDDPAVLVVHRILHTFVEGERALVIHQGDATGAAFGVAPRGNVVARVTSPRPAPDAPRFFERRLVCRAYALARRLATSAGLRRSPVAHRCGELFRRLAARLPG